MKTTIRRLRRNRSLVIETPEGFLTLTLAPGKGGIAITLPGEMKVVEGMSRAIQASRFFQVSDSGVVPTYSAVVPRHDSIGFVGIEIQRAPQTEPAQRLRLAE